MNKNLRVHTNINEDTVLNVNLQQDFDFLEVLSLKISQEDLYKFDKSNYGVIVGRVLANDAFGIPNAKISIFIPIEDGDVYRSDITNLYPFSNVRELNQDNIRYNVLPDSKDDECYRNVGTFPNKRLVLDDDSVLEVFDKYYKYTTVTNNGGDYMFYGIPTGNTTLHVDIDLSDIGVLSQKPRDFYYKGYSETLFDNANQFKSGTNLDNLTQIITQNHGVLVYPFFGDEDDTEVAITRCDVQIQYKFEPTCVFFGSLVTDTFGANIGHDCDPHNTLGENKKLIASEGTIEMIRKTIDGLTEEYQIQGNRLIDGDGVWCYQIPMNLDYVGTDEFGNIVATDNPNKGIPTRCRARFRFSIEETDSDYVSRHRAKYLVPNNPRIDYTKSNPTLLNDNGTTLEKHYNFGSATMDEDYRDMFWNCIYTVKNYIPRLQNSSNVSTLHYTSLKATNYSENLNPIPFNKARFRLRFAYKLLCIIMTIVSWIVALINEMFINPLDNICLPWPIKKCLFNFPCIYFNNGLSEDDSENVIYAPGCEGKARRNTDCPKDGKVSCRINPSIDDLMDKIQQLLAQEYENVRLDFYNDWINGCLYFPLWFWKRTKKKKYLFGLFKKSAVNSYCQCDKEWGNLCIMDTCTVSLDNQSDKGERWDKRAEVKKTIWGVIKDVTNKDDLTLYYYSCGVVPYKNPKNENDFIRLFATDLVLLGSFNDCDLNGLPKPYLNLPPTTANIPPLGPIKQIPYDSTDDDETAIKNAVIKVSGMDWENSPVDNYPYYGKGLIMGLSCTDLTAKTKSCINLNRLSELGVSSDITYQDWFRKDNSLKRKQILNDGLITKTEIDDEETRGMFATLNHKGLDMLRFDTSTGYKTYDLQYVFPTNFDGRQTEKVIKKYTDGKTKDVVDEEYKLFRFGGEIPIYYDETGQIGKKEARGEFYLYNNSFYFYFGLNLGKTAIEKFNGMFNATCYKNTKYPFNMIIDKIAASTALHDANENGTYNCGDVTPDKYGVIDVTLKGIKKPYSYVLKTFDGDEILNEKNLNINKLVFGVVFDTDTKQYVVPTEGDIIYTDTDGETYKRNGLFKKFMEDGESAGVVKNGKYILTITDTNGKGIEEIIELSQPALNLSNDSLNLTTNFIPKQDEDVSENLYSTPEDIYCHGFDGQISINGVIIDGDVYTISNGENIVWDNSESGISKTELIVESPTKPNTYQKIQLQIRINYFEIDTDVRQDEWTNFIEHVCNNGSVICNGEEIPTIYFDGETKTLTFRVWIPGEYEFTITQYDCIDGKEKLIDNENTITFDILNGEKFETLINDVPVTFLNSTADNSIIEMIEDAKYFNVNKEYLLSEKGYDTPSVFYNFPNVSTNKSLWHKYISYDTVEDENGKQYASNETKLDALVYKIQSICNLSNGVFFTKDSNNFTFSTKGGEKNIIQSVYPDYDGMNETEIYFNGGSIDNTVSTYRFWNADAYDSITCDDSHPNIVSDNYKAFSNDYMPFTEDDENFYHSILQPTVTFGFNPIICNNPWDDGNRYGFVNYFASFTNNGGVNVTDDSVMIKSHPSYAQPLKNEGGLISYSHQDFDTVMSYDTSETLKNWDKVCFIDKRLSYVGKIFTSTKLNGEIIEDDVFNGRVVFNATNGIQMAYDENYNIVGFSGDNLEYVIDIDDYTSDETMGTDVKTYYNDSYNILDCEDCLIPRKLFYTSKLNLDFKPYDMRYAWYNNSIEDVWMNDGNYPIGPNGLVISATTKTTGSTEPYLVIEPDITTFGVTKYDSYPFKQYFDLRNVDIVNNVSLTLESCSYNVDAGIKQNGLTSELENLSVEAITQGCDLNEIVVGCNNFINFDAANKDNLKANNFNVLCNSEGNDTLTVTPSFGRFAFKLGRDYLTSDYYYTSYVPSLKIFEDEEGLMNMLETIKTSNCSINEMFEFYDGIQAKLYSLSEEDGNINDSVTFLDNYFLVNDNKILQQNGSHENLVPRILMKFEDYINNTKIIDVDTKWNTRTPAYKNSNGVDLERAKYLMILTGREYYLQDNSENLEKVVRVIDCNDVYAFEPFTVYDISISPFSGSSKSISGDIASFSLNFLMDGETLGNNQMAYCNLSDTDFTVSSVTECDSYSFNYDSGITEVHIYIQMDKETFQSISMGTINFDILFVNSKNLTFGFSFEAKINLQNYIISDIKGKNVVS